MNISKLVNTKKEKNYWLYIVLGSVILVLGVMFLPLWLELNVDVFFANWGIKITKTIIAVLLALYLVLYLIKKVAERNKGVIKVLTIIEFVLLSLVALGCVLSQFNVLPLTDAGSILGFVFWLRGIIEIFRAYYYEKSDSKKYPVWWLVIAIIFVSVGMAFMVGGYLQNVHVVWLLSSTLILLGVVAIILGFVKKPSKSKK